MVINYKLALASIRCPCYNLAPQKFEKDRMTQDDRFEQEF
jgi:hypothetical protein